MPEWYQPSRDIEHFHTPEIKLHIEYHKNSSGQTASQAYYESNSAQAETFAQIREKVSIALITTGLPIEITRTYENGTTTQVALQLYLTVQNWDFEVVPATDVAELAPKLNKEIARLNILIYDQQLPIAYIAATFEDIPISTTATETIVGQVSYEYFPLPDKTGTLNENYGNVGIMKTALGVAYVALFEAGITKVHALVRKDNPQSARTQLSVPALAGLELRQEVHSLDNEHDTYVTTISDTNS